MEILDISTVVIFLALTLYIGISAGKDIKSIKGYAVGGRRYGTFALFATLSASFIGGGYTFGNSEKTFIYGMVYVVCLWGFSFQQFLVATVLAPRMGRFQDAISVGDIMYKLYGKFGRIIAGFTSVLVCAGIIGAQVTAIGFVFDLFLDIKQVYGVIIGCGIVISYSVVGGIRAVVATDMLQFLVLITMIPLSVYFGIEHLGGFDYVLTHVPDTHFSIPGEMSYLMMASLFLSFLCGEALVPPYVQRLLITRDLKHTKRGTLYSSLLSFPFFAVGGFMGLIALSHLPTLEPNLSLPAVINLMPNGLKGIAIASIIAVIMSSADSYLNAAAIAVVHDIIRPLQTNKMDSVKELHITRYATFMIGVLAVIFALNIKSAMDLLLYSYNFWSPMILVPLVAGILGYRLRVYDFVVCMLMGITAVVLWNSYFEQTTEIDGLVIGVVANLLTFTLFVLSGRAKGHNELEVLDNEEEEFEGELSLDKGGFA